MPRPAAAANSQTIIDAKALERIAAARIAAKARVNSMRLIPATAIAVIFARKAGFFTSAPASAVNIHRRDEREEHDDAKHMRDVGERIEEMRVAHGEPDVRSLKRDKGSEEGIHAQRSS